MVDMWLLANAVACLVAAGVLSIIVLHPGIKEGLVVKAGLIAMILSLCATSALVFGGSVDWDAYWRAGFTLRAGLAVACLGIVIKAHRIGRSERRYSQADVHQHMTNRWLNQIADPVRDLSHLFRDERTEERHQ